MGHPLRGILFDLGDTLLDFGDVDVNAEFEKGARLAYDYLTDLGLPMPSFKTYHRKQFFSVRFNYILTHLHGRDFNALDLIGRFSRRMGHKITHEQLVELAWLWYEPVRKCATLEPGLHDMLKTFGKDGLKLGLLSNTFIPPEVLDRHLAQEDLLKFLPVRIYSCELSHRKPHPSIFARAAEKMALPPEELMFVGNCLKADVRGANRAGMVSVLKDPTGRRHTWRVKPDHRIRRLTDLPQILDLYSR